MTNFSLNTMCKWLCNLTLVALLPCAAAHATATQFKSPLQVIVEQLSNVKNNPTITPIDGAWSLQGADYANCAEVYNFTADSHLRITSANEVTTAQYEFSRKLTRISQGNAGEAPAGEEITVNLPLPMLRFIITHDNNEPDCLGSKIDQRGQSDTWLVKLSDGDRLMQWCVNENDCRVSLKRLLP